MTRESPRMHPHPDPGPSAVPPRAAAAPPLPRSRRPDLIGAHPRRVLGTSDTPTAVTILDTEKVERAIERSSLDQRGQARPGELSVGRAPEKGTEVHLYGGRQARQHTIRGHPAGRVRSRALRSSLMASRAIFAGGRARVRRCPRRRWRRRAAAAAQRRSSAPARTRHAADVARGLRLGPRPGAPQHAGAIAADHRRNHGRSCRRHARRPRAWIGCGSCCRGARTAAPAGSNDGGRF